MFQKNYLKRLYEIDNAIEMLKLERKKLISIIEVNKIEQHGQFKLIRNSFDIRKINLEKYKSLVSKEIFDQSIGVSIHTAEKYLTQDQIKAISFPKPIRKLKVIKV